MSEQGTGLFPVGDCHKLLQLNSGELHLNAQLLRFRDVDLLSSESHEGKQQGGSFRNGDPEDTVDIGDCSLGSTLDYDRNTRQCLSLIVVYCSRNGYILCQKMRQ